MKYNKYNWYPGYDDELIDPPTIADKIAQIINKYMQPCTLFDAQKRACTTRRGQATKQNK